jgi:hypothetical protein
MKYTINTKETYFLKLINNLNKIELYCIKFILSKSKERKGKKE